jgi:signal peptidase I
MMGMKKRNANPDRPGRSAAGRNAGEPPQREGAARPRGEGVARQRGEGVVRQGGEGSARQRGEGSARERGEGSARERGEGVARDRGEGVARDRGEGAVRDRGEGAVRDRGEGAVRDRGEGAVRQGGEGSARQRGAGSAAPATPAGGERPRSRAGEWARSLIGGFLIFLVVQTFVLQTFTITSGSMENTLLVGDFLVLSKSAYGATIPGTELRAPGYSKPRRGDIVVFRGHHEPLDVVKRLVAMQGDTIEMVDGVFHLNGVAQDEPYVERTYPDGDGWHPAMEWQTPHLAYPARAGSYAPSRDNWGPLIVPDERYFVLGDNRDDSLDSRYYGFIMPEQVKGRAVALYFSYDRTAVAGVPLLGNIRWGRVGERLR